MLMKTKKAMLNDAVDEDELDVHDEVHEDVKEAYEEYDEEILKM